MSDNVKATEAARPPWTPDPASKIQRMIRPEELRRNEPLFWSTGMGTDVWDLFCACIAGDLGAVERLVSKDPSIVRCHWHYRKPLYFAVRENQLEIASYLLERDPDPTGLAVNDSLLDIARDRGYAEMERMLESRLASQHGASPRGESIAESIRERNLAKVRGLLDASPDLVHAGDSRSNQPIHWAVMTRQPDVIDELLARGADINARRQDGARPIQLTNGDYHYRGWDRVPGDVAPEPHTIYEHLRARGADCDLCTAAYFGDLERVKALCDQDPSLANRPSDYVTYYACSGTPLRNAADGGHIEIVKLLLERGADPNLPEEGIAPRGHALYAAACRGHIEIARLLLEKGAYANVEVESSADTLSRVIGRDPSMVELLCSYGAARAVHLLAHHGDVLTAAAVFAANPGLANDPEALSNAAGQGHEAFVRLMLLHRPDLASRVSGDSRTRALSKFLFVHGANPNQAGWLRITRLHEYARHGDVERAALFLDQGADLHARDEDICSTPLGWAAKFGKSLMVEFLLRRGARLNLPDDPPWATPLAWATRRKNDSIVAMLRHYERHGSLPSQLSLEQYQALVDDWIKAHRLGDAGSLKRLQAHYQQDRTLTEDQVRRHVHERLGVRADQGSGTPPATFDVAHAELLVARSHGFESWVQLSKYVESYPQADLEGMVQK